MPTLTKRRIIVLTVSNACYCFCYQSILLDPLFDLEVHSVHVGRCGFYFVNLYCLDWVIYSRLGLLW